jgi:hypothetical protein
MKGKIVKYRDMYKAKVIMFPFFWWWQDRLPTYNTKEKAEEAMYEVYGIINPPFEEIEESQ